MDIWWTLHLKREAASVPLARRILLGAMDSAGVDQQISHEIGIALTEACANAVEHASGSDPDEGFQVTASIDGDRLRIEVVDSGPGLPPGGLAPLPPLPPLPALGLPVLQAAVGAPVVAALAPVGPVLPVAAPVAPVPAAPVPTTPLPTVPVPVATARGAARCTGRRGRTTVISRAAVMASLSPAAVARRVEYDTHLLDCRPALPPAAQPAAFPAGLDGGGGTELPDPTAESGRGLFLIRALSDEVRFLNHPRRGAIVSFDKILKWQDDALLRAVS